MGWKGGLWCILFLFYISIRYDIVYDGVWLYFGCDDEGYGV